MHQDVVAVIFDSYSDAFKTARGLLPLNGHSFLEELAARLRQVAGVQDVVVATSDQPCDDALAAKAEGLGLAVFRGPRRDVLTRALRVVKALGVTHILKASGSAPLLDTQYAARMLREHQEKNADITTAESSTCIIRGMGCEIIRAASLLALEDKTLTPFQREFFTQYFKQRAKTYAVHRLPSALSRPNWKVSVGRKEDYILVKEIVARHAGQPVTESSLVALLDSNQHLLDLNTLPEKGEEVGLHKILLFWEKIGSIMEASANGHVDMHYPISVELSLTDTCQLHCLWCSDYQLRKKNAATLPKEDVFALVDDLTANGAKGLVIEGGGEPTLHPDFEAIVAYCRAKKLPLGLITNGVRPVPAALLDAFEWIRVSLDASTPEEFRELKGRNAFDAVISNLYLMVGKGPVVGVGYVLTNRNWQHLESLVYVLQDIGVDYLHIRPVVDHPELSCANDISYLREFTYQQFPILLNAINENKEPGNKNLPCVAHSVTTVVSSAGDVYICGRLNINDWLAPLGNIRGTDFKTIWTGKERIAQSRRLEDSAFCAKNCPQCRITKFNELFASQKNIKSKHFI